MSTDNKVSIKVCGMTREADVKKALLLGADYLGFIVYPKSPRALTLERAAEVSALVPERKRVLVDVETSLDNLESYKRAGFNYFQIHVEPSLDRQTLDAYSSIVGRDQLLLAPRLAPEDPFPERMLDYTGTILCDTYSKNQVGGTGRTGDFARFAELKKRFTNTDWVLAGGLNPSNIVNAIKESTTSAVDVSSGVEAAPGIKDPEKLRAFFQALYGLHQS